MKLLAPDSTGRERVKFTGKGRTPFELEDPDARQRMGEDAPAAPASRPERRGR